MSRFARCLPLIFMLFLALYGACLKGPLWSEETITKKQRDILLLMCAMENPNFDIVLAIDISGSMDKVLPDWKKMAEKTIDIAQKGDTLVLVKFDDTTRPPLIQEIQTERDKELFKATVRKTAVTHGWGTDIRRAYWLTLKTLKEFDEGRSKKGEPVRLQQVVFISDGDDLPPDKSAFRNPGSAESQEMADLIREAQKTMRINIIPIGMKFENYVPKIRSIKQEGATPAGEDKVSQELKKFMDKLQDVFNRNCSEIKDDNATVPKTPFDFYITWLSNRLELTKKEMAPSKNPYHRTFSYDVTSRFRKLKIRDLTTKADYQGTGGGIVKKGAQLSDSSLAPGTSATLNCLLSFPKNWSFSARPYSGDLTIEVGGTMDVNLEVPVPGTPAGKRTLTYSYPIVPRKAVVNVSGTLPPCIELFLLLGGALAGIAASVFLVVYKNIVPITITLKTETRAHAFTLRNQESITIGSGSDFEVEGAKEQVASIMRKGRTFTFLAKKEGILPESTYGPAAKSLDLKFGQSVSLTIEGSYVNLSFLEGDQADSPSEMDPTAPSASVDDEGGGGFSF
jgi:hypothetical protein